MADNDYNIIKPVENLQNVGAITPAKRQEEKKQRQKQNQKRALEQQLSNQADEQGTGNQNDETDTDQHSIDYCA